MIRTLATPGDGSGVVQPCDIAICADGSYVLTDSHRLIRLFPDKRQTKKGRGTWLVAGASGVPGCMDGVGQAARFSSPFGIAIGPDGFQQIVADTSNNILRAVDGMSAASHAPARKVTVSTLAGKRKRQLQPAAPADDRNALEDDRYLDASFGYDSDENLDDDYHSCGGNADYAPREGFFDRTDFDSGVCSSVSSFGSGGDVAAAIAGLQLRLFEPKVLFGDRSHDAGGVGTSTPSSSDDDLPPSPIDPGPSFPTPPSPILTAREAASLALIKAQTFGGGRGVASPPREHEVLLLPDGPAERAEFNGPLGVAVHPDGTVVVTESWQHAVRSVKGGVVRTLAGLHCSSGCVDSNGDSARFFGLLGIAVLPNGGSVVADRDNCRVRTISASGGVITLAGSGQQGNDDGTTRMDATFSIPSSVAADVAGRVVVADNAADWSSAALRVIDPHTNTVRTLELKCADSGGSVALTVDTKIAIDAHGNIVCANSAGVHLVTNTGLAPGFSAWWRPMFWKQPRRRLGRLLGSASTCDEGARAALKTVFLIAARLDVGSSTEPRDGGSAIEQQRPQQCAPPLSRLPNKLWHQILGMLQPWQLGSGQSDVPARL